MVDLRELILKVSQAKDKLELQNLKTQFLGKNSQINQEFRKLGSLSEEEKKIAWLNYHYHLFTLKFRANLNFS